MIREGLLALLVLGCSAASGSPVDPPTGDGTGGNPPAQGGESGAPAEPTSGTGGSTVGAGGTGGTGGSEPDLCQPGDERLCSCAPGYGGRQTCSAFGWNTCICPDWPPAGAGGSSDPGPTWPTCPRDPLDTSTARHPNGCPASWPNVSETPDCTADSSAAPNSGLCTFDCRAPGTCGDAPCFPPLLVFSESRASLCKSVGGTCSETAPLCLPE